MIILPFIPILALLLQTSFSLYEILQYRSEVNEIETQVNKAEVYAFFLGGAKMFSMNESGLIFITSLHLLFLNLLDIRS